LHFDLLINEADATSGTAAGLCVIASTVPPSRVVGRPVCGGPVCGVGRSRGLGSVRATTAAAASAAPGPAAASTTAVVTALVAIVGAVSLAAAALVTVRLSTLVTVPALPLVALAPVAVDWLGQDVIKADETSVDVSLALGVSLPLEPALFPVAVKQASCDVSHDCACSGSDERVDGGVAGSKETGVNVAVAAVAAVAAAGHIDPFASGIDVDLG